MGWHIVESGCLAHALIGITAKYYAPHSELRQITGVGPAGIAESPDDDGESGDDDRRQRWWFHAYLLLL